MTRPLVPAAILRKGDVVDLPEIGEVALTAVTRVDLGPNYRLEWEDGETVVSAALHVDIVTMADRR